MPLVAYAPGRIAALITLSWVLLGSAACAPEEEPSPIPPERYDRSIPLAISITDETSEVPPHESLALHVPGHGAWRPSLRYGGITKTFSEFQVGEPDTIRLYPQGREQTALKIPFVMKPDMVSGVANSTTRITIRDDSFVVKGPAVGEERLALPR